MKRRTLVIVVSGAGAVAAVAVLFVALGANAAERPPSDATVGVHSTQNPQDVARYWTRERMRDAKGG